MGGEKENWEEEDKNGKIDCRPVAIGGIIASAGGCVVSHQCGKPCVGTTHYSSLITNAAAAIIQG